MAITYHFEGEEIPEEMKGTTGHCIDCNYYIFDEDDGIIISFCLYHNCEVEQYGWCYEYTEEDYAIRGLKTCGFMIELGSHRKEKEKKEQ